MLLAVAKILQVDFLEEYGKLKNQKIKIPNQVIESSFMLRD